jgi:hypothetical protein
MTSQPAEFVVAEASRLSHAFVAFVAPNAEAGETTVDLIGSAGYIFWGPYLHLPFGTWRASIQFEVAEIFSGNEIEADILLPDSQTEIARRMTELSVRLPGAGQQRRACALNNPAPGGNPDRFVNIGSPDLERLRVARSHEREDWAISLVVECPETKSTSSTFPPRAWTRSAPTTSSSL